MPNPHATGQPRKGLEKITTKLTPEVLAKARAIALQQGWNLNTTLDLALRCQFGLEAPYDQFDWELILKDVFE